MDANKFSEEDKGHFEMSVHPIKRNGHVSGFSEITRNITEHKKMEEMLLEAKTIKR